MHNPIAITSILTEDLDETARAEIILVCIEAHHEDSFKKLFTYVPRGGTHFLARLDGRLVSHAMITTRWLQPESLPLLKTAYVDAVATLPEYQGRGYGSQVMQRLAADIDGQYQAACLETDRMTFYARLGWKTWRGPLAGRSEGGLVPTPDQKGIMVLQLSQTPVLDLDSFLTIECQTGRIW
jgi:aminoglycoside 2'-N-acetyltransferase I